MDLLSAVRRTIKLGSKRLTSNRVIIDRAERCSQTKETSNTGEVSWRLRREIGVTDRHVAS